MSCSGISNAVPGTPTFSSGLTTQRAAAARRCDQARILAQLRSGTISECCASTPSNKSAIYASILTQDKAVACQANQVTQAFQFPRAGTTESIRLQNKVSALATCSIDPYDPEQRYPLLRRYVPQAPCPAPTAEQLNSTTPKPTFAPGCQPSRFF
jgi:hypothetical protein